MSDATLRRALRANAAFSALTGATLLLGATLLAAPLGLPAAALAVVGASLLPFAGAVAWLSRAPSERPAAALAVSVADLAWVLGTLVLLATPHPETPLGRGAAVAVALVVAACAAGQLVGLWRVQLARAASLA